MSINGVPSRTSSPQTVSTLPDTSPARRPKSRCGRAQRRAGGKPPLITVSSSGPPELRRRCLVETVDQVNVAESVKVPQPLREPLINHHRALGTLSPSDWTGIFTNSLNGVWMIPIVSTGIVSFMVTPPGQALIRMLLLFRHRNLVPDNLPGRFL